MQRTLEDFIRQSKLTDEEKSNLFIFAKYGGVPTHYTDIAEWKEEPGRHSVPVGSEELFRALMLEPDEDDMLKMSWIGYGILAMQNGGTSYGENLYKGIQKLSGGRFSVDDFEALVDYDDYDTDYPYKGHISFSYQGAKWYYAPHSDEFELDLLNFINYFLCSKGLTSKRLFWGCFRGSEYGMIYGEDPLGVLVERDQYELLAKYHYFEHTRFHKPFWEMPAEPVHFKSVTRGQQ